MFKSKKLSLLMALVFAFTVIMPVGAAFAAEDNVTISGGYEYAKADDEVRAGVARVVYDEWEDGTDNVVVQITLPDGVEFTDKPKTDNEDWFKGYGADCEVVNVESDYFEVKFNNFTNNGNDFKAEFDFGYDADDDDKYDASKGDIALDIDSDFTGNVEAFVEVIGMKGNKVLWNDYDDVIIAKVSGGDVDVVVGSTKKVSAGSGKDVADITLEESMAGAFSDDEWIRLEIETDGVEFYSLKVNPTRVEVNGQDEEYSYDQDDTDANAYFDENFSLFKIKVTDVSKGLPGQVKFDDIQLNVDPDVTGDIEISVISDGDAEIDETVVVASVGDVTAEISKVEDNDTVAYAGQETALDVEFTLETTDGSDFGENAGDIITFELNEGEFVDFGEKKVVQKGKEGNAKTYSDAEAFYYTVHKDDKDQLKFGKNLKVKLDNDAEPGDIVLTVSGDYGDLGEIVIGQIAKPFSVTAEKPAILAEALGQEAGDLIITETDNDAFNKNDVIVVELPSGVELSAKPKVEVEEGNADAEIIKGNDDDYFVIKITKTSGSKPSVLRVYNIKYDTGKLALTGDVELKFLGDKDIAEEESADNYTDDSVFFKVANATVVDQNEVTATFTVGDEGVVVKNGRVLVQVNTLCDVLGLQKSWDEVNKIAYFVKGGTVVAFPIDKNEISINGNVLPVDQGGTIIDGFTYATLRGLEMAFGGELDWDNDTKTATFKF